MPARTRQAILAALILLWVSFPAAAIDSLRWQSGSLNFAGVDLSQLDINISLSNTGLALQASADRFDMADQQLNNLSLNCPLFKIAAGFWQCQQGQLQFTHALLGPQQLAVDFSANTTTAQYQFDIKQLAVAGGRLQAAVKLTDKSWQARIDNRQLDTSVLLTLLTQLLPDIDLTLISSWQPRAVISGIVDIKGTGGQVQHADISLNSADTSFSDASGNRVAESLDLQLAVTADYQQQAWRFKINTAINSGQSYWAPVFLDFAQTPVQLSFNGLIEPDNQRWQMNDVQFRQQGVLTAEGAVQSAQQQIHLLQINMSSSPLAAIYQWWIQPFVPGTAAANLNTDGNISLRLDWQGEHFDLQTDLQQLAINDADGRFAIDGLDGRFAWTTASVPVAVDIGWQQISIGALPLDAGQLRAEVSNNQLTLSEVLDLPLLDGGLQISNFHYQFAPQGSHWQFEGLLKPLSMQALTGALGWPLMEGKLSGVIPRVSYQDQQIDIEGALQVRVFDGTAIVTDLQLQSPLGSLPQLTANIDLQRLDLELLTRTFDFGRISGRLDGRVSDLRLVSWQPVQFDAKFATAANNPGKRRISQRAVDNLSQIGGGASGIMSRSFLRFFDDFSYDKLGIRCQLANEVCQMSGIEDDEQGYYIVKAGGLPPWINVMGYTRRVDWPDLLARLKAVKNSDGPIIE